MHELAALVEERGVVFVRFHDEVLTGAEPRRNAEVHRHPADQKARLQARVLQQPGQQAGCRGLAVGAGHGQHMAAGQYVFGQPLRTGDVWQSLIQHVFDRRIAARDDVAHHHHIRRRLQMLGRVAGHQLNALRLELRGHGWPGIGIRSGHAMPGLARQRRDTGHESAADSEDVKVHQGLLAPSPSICATAPSRLYSMKVPASVMPTPMKIPISSAQR